MKLEDETIKADIKGFWGGKFDLYQLITRKVQGMKKTGIVLLAVVVGLMVYLEIQIIELLEIFSNLNIMW